MLETFSQTSLKVKIFATVGLCLAALIGVATFASWQMNKIGQELVAIAEQDIPLTNMLTQISTHQLEQTIEFERMLRFALEARDDSHAQKAYAHSVEKFVSIGKKVTDELHQGEALAETSASHAHSAEAKAEFEFDCLGNPDPASSCLYVGQSRECFRCAQSLQGDHRSDPRVRD